jgi:hypothetical protein
MNWTLSTFTTLVQQMRKAQRDYYRLRHKSTTEQTHTLLKRALWFEAECDKALLEIASGTPLFDEPELPA